MQALRIENHILKTELLDISLLTPLQGGLKTMTDENFNKLRKSLIEKGFQFTIHVWESGGVIYIIDGHQRVHVMQQLRKEGYEIPQLNCAFVKAANYSEAKELIFYAISQYGKIDKTGYDDFTLGENFDMWKFDLPDFKLELPPENNDVPPNPMEVEGSTKMSEELSIDQEFLVLTFNNKDDLASFNRMIKNEEECGYWLSRQKKNPAFFRKGPNRVLEGRAVLKVLQELL
jgi:hypothetical protein